VYIILINSISTNLNAMSGSSEPQSIVHQVIRLERKVSGMITGPIRRRRKRSSRKSQGLGGASDHSGMSFASSQDDPGSCDSDSFFSGASISINHASVADDQTFESRTKPETSPTDTVNDLKTLTVSVPKPRYGDYRTIDQNEFFVECMINGEGSAIVHFFDEASSKGKELDEHLKKMAMKFTGCKFLRINGAWTQFVSARLGITKFPTIVALRNKVMLDRMAGFDKMESFCANDLEQWILKTVPMIDEK
jgi:hypothetical protein